MQTLSKEILSFLEKKESILELNEIPREASPRMYYRVKYASGNKILCIDEKLNGRDYPFLLVREFLEKWLFSVPFVYDVDFNLFCILQSDVGNKDLSELDGEDYENYLKQSLIEILRLQELSPIPIIQSRMFDYQKLSFELNHTYSGYERFIEKDSSFPVLHYGLKNFFDDSIRQLSIYEPKVICHRDFHARNLMLDSHNKIFWIDFQDMMMGTPQYDLVSILYDAYKPLTQNQREYYYQFFKEKSFHKNKKFRENYLLQALQRSFKALGTYFVMYNDKGYHKYKSSILPCLQNLIEITQLGRFPDTLYLQFKEIELRWRDYLERN